MPLPDSNVRMQNHILMFTHWNSGCLRKTILLPCVLQFLILAALWPCQAEIVPNVTANASSGLYWEIAGNPPRVVYDRRALHAADGSGLCCGTTPTTHGGGEGMTWESVGNGWTGSVGLPSGDDPAPWIEFTFPQAYTISSMNVWNFGEYAKAVYRAEVIADGTVSLGNFIFQTNHVVVSPSCVPDGCWPTLKEVIQFSSPVSARSFRLRILENGGRITFPAATNGFTTLVGLSEVQFNIAPPDLKPTSLAWNPNAGGIKFSYRVDGGAILSPTDVSFFWANGTNLANKLSSEPFYFDLILTDFSGQSAIINVPWPDLMATG